MGVPGEVGDCGIGPSWLLVDGIDCIAVLFDVPGSDVVVLQATSTGSIAAPATAATGLITAGTRRRLLAEVLIVGDVFEPVDGAPVDEGLDGDVGHRGVVGRAVPVLDPGWSPDDVAFGDALLLPAPLLDPTVAGGAVEGLSARGGGPGTAWTPGE